MRTTGFNEYRLIPSFLDISFKGEKGKVGIKEFVTELYNLQRIDVLVSMYRFLEPNSYYPAIHGYEDMERFNPLIHLYKSYDPKTHCYKTNDRLIKHHIDNDVRWLKKHAEKLTEMQIELNKVLEGIRAAQSLNLDIATVYKDVSDLDVQRIWKYHDWLYHQCLEEVILSELEISEEKSEELIQDILNDISDSKDLTRQEVPSEESSYDEDECDPLEDPNRREKVLKLIRKREKYSKINGMPPFDLVRYRKVREYMKSPHFDSENAEYVIAKFAGENTPLLEEGLKEIKLKYGEPVRNPRTGAWSYTIDYTSNFRGLVYRNLLDFVNEMMEWIGYVPTCAWCGKAIHPTSQQLRKLREHADIYCSAKGQSAFNSCAKQGTAFKQNQKRNKKKEVRRQIKNVEVLDSYRLKNHLEGKMPLSAGEQADANNGDKILNMNGLKFPTNNG